MNIRNCVSTQTISLVTTGSFATDIHSRSAFVDHCLGSAIQNADRRAKRYGEEFFVVRFSRGMEVITGAELEWRIGECPSIFYSTKTGYYLMELDV